MSFNDLVSIANRTAHTVLGEPAQVTHILTSVVVTDVMVIIDRDIEVIDESGQVMGRTNLICVNHADLPFTPSRGDTVVAGSVTYTLGKRQADDGASYLFEATT